MAQKFNYSVFFNAFVLLNELYILLYKLFGLMSGAVRLIPSMWDELFFSNIY